ncbi:MAG: redoxin domain-containing protein [Acetobacteraceae bacterium]|nr:redoxin domain-containing protein [Acetobacteraceae bacterium]
MQMEAYRDQYATLFNNGRDVVVLGISVDPDTTLASWAREADFPMLFASDPQGAAGTLYGAWNASRNRVNDRAVFVIGPDGRVAHAIRAFNQLSARAYEELGAVVDSLSPPRAPDR